MKTVIAIKKRNRSKDIVVRRGGRVYIINKKTPKFKKDGK